MSNVTPMKIGSPTFTITATTSTAATQLPANMNTSLYIIVKNGGSFPVAITSGNSTITATFPTATSQPVTVFLPGEIGTYKKNNSNDGYIATISSGGSSIIYPQVGEGV